MRGLLSRLARALRAPEGPAAEAALLVVEQMPAVTYLGDFGTAGGLRYLSPQVEALTGYPAADWTGGRRSWLELVHPDDRPYVLAAHRHSRSSGLPFNVEYRIVTRQGRICWVHHRANTVSAPGRAPYIQGVLMDISDRRQVEEALRESEVRYRTLVEASPDAITVTDLQGRVVMCNERSGGLFGVPAGQLVGRDVFDFVAPANRAEVAEAAERALRGAGPERVAYDCVPAGRDPVPVELTLSAIRDADGETLALMGISRDISERLAAAEALRESERRSRFLATMSHELRTPLNSILGFAQLLTSGAFGRLDSRQARYIGNIQSSGEHLLSLVEALLDLSRMAAGEMAVERQVVGVEALLNAALDQVRPQAAEKQIRLECELQGRPRVLADPRRLAQIMANLLSNAVKFTPSGGRVAVAARDDGDAVVITVTDNGIGIPAAQQERIFNEFVQVESGRSRNQEGSGLGLALSRRLAELMGGSISLVSVVGQGSAFAVRLPAAAYDLSGVRDHRPGSRDPQGDRAAVRAEGGPAPAR